MTTTNVAPPADDRKDSWRDVLPIHPACAAYPRISEGELAELGRDIKAHGLQVDIVVLLEGKKTSLLDGIGRLDAIEGSGIDLVNEKGELDPTLGLGGGCRVRVVTGVDPFEFAASLNAHRRHLTIEQKRERVIEALKKHPEKSDRMIAKEEKVTHKAVAKARKATGPEVQLEKRVGADGKERKQRSSPPKVMKGDAAKPMLNEAVAFADAIGSAGNATKAAVFPPETDKLAQQVEKLRGGGEACARDLEPRAAVRD
jgi:hypothetical protein